jgi:hypothetical protein
LLPACQKTQENVKSRHEQSAQTAYNSALDKYSRELELADEIAMRTTPSEELEKEFAKVIKQIVIDQNKAGDVASYPYSTYYVAIQSNRNKLQKYPKRLEALNVDLAENIKNLIKKLDTLLKQVHKTFYDELTKEQRDIDMSTDMAYLTGNSFAYASVVFSKPRIKKGS